MRRSVFWFFCMSPVIGLTIGVSVAQIYHTSAPVFMTMTYADTNFAPQALTNYADADSRKWAMGIPNNSVFQAQYATNDLYDGFSSRSYTEIELEAYRKHGIVPNISREFLALSNRVAQLEKRFAELEAK